MANNELQPGEPRLGWFVDGDPDTEMIAVMLRDTGSAIELTVPFQDMGGRDDPYRRWWSDGVHFGDDPDRTLHTYAPPRQLLVADADGQVVLVGCRSTESTSNFAVGRGRIVANFAVLGGRHLNYDTLNGLRTDIPALAAWTRLSSMTLDVEADERSRVQSVQMKLTSAEAISLARQLNLVMQSTWRTEKPTGEFRAYEAVELQTTAERARPWDEHLGVHRAILELVSIAGWRPFGIARTTVQRHDDPHRTMDREDLGERWLPVATHRFPKHSPWAKNPHFLYPWAEVGPRGVKRWLKLRKTYGRVVGPLLSILHSDNPWSQPSVVQSGIALEALGYLIDIEKNDGAHLNNRKQMNFKPGLHVILDDMSVEPFEDVTGWVKRADAAYMGAKHPDRTEPDSLDMLNTLRENLLVLRCWIGLQLGVRPASLKSTLRSDSLTNPFVGMD